ncbi:uncharacterized protein LOC106167906 [Lingula anatina]|uniref:Uncharacterized protein LOC106167906 n=1 Tax=Lingula anatina TaxID=7574 RepID=A0A1S3IVN6_LINAN|nr:uncharacterized protein LOC106167906 [Lingula anatina]|eukprot:XP_013402255.1 uncharacterized protein LOC106167906 [Lingula anatina]
MTTIANHRENVAFLEKGIKSLRRSRLMQVREFKDMFSMIEHHHRDIRLAHLTGKAKDLIEHDQQDTKFFNILVHMLGEVSMIESHQQQKQDLQKVHSWFMANKQTLHSAPIFGRAKKQLATQGILRIDPRTGSMRPYSGSTGSARSRRNKAVQLMEVEQFESPRLQSPPQLNREKITQGKPLKATAPSKEKIQNENIAPAALPATEVPNNTPPASTETKPIPQPPPAPREDVTVPPRMVHPVAALVNPHVVQLSEHHPSTPQPHFDIDQMSDVSSPVKIRVESNPDNLSSGQLSPDRTRTPLEERNARLRSWNEFQQDQTYGQEMLGSLQFIGRGGQPQGVRYAAHDLGETPEEYTKDIVVGYSRLHGTGPAPGIDPKMLVSQTTEEFYQLAEGYYPDTPKYPSSVVAAMRPKSTPPGAKRSASVMTNFGAMRSRAATPKNRSKSALGAVSLQHVMPDPPPEPKPRLDVKLDTVVNLIDSVTDDLNYYKEKLTPEPLNGFRPPTAVVVASRPNTAVPFMRSNPPTSPQSERNDESPREEDSEWTVHFSRPQPPPAVQNPVMQAIDWRGRITPDTTRYKWATTSFGGHTYMKKLKQKISHRSAGSTSAGKRPKTAPMTVREKWNTDKPSDDNSRIAQAASNTVTQVDPSVVSSMVKVHNLGSGNPSKLPKIKRVRIVRPGEPEDDILSKVKQVHHKVTLFSPEGGSSAPSFRADYPPPGSKDMEFLSLVAPRSILIPPKKDGHMESMVTTPRDVNLPVPLHSAAGDSPSISSAHVSQKYYGYKGSDSNMGDGDRPDTMLKSLDMDLINRLQVHHKVTLFSPEGGSSTPSFRADYPPPGSKDMEFLSLVAPRSILIPPKKDGHMESMVTTPRDVNLPVPLHSAAGDSPSISSAHVSQKYYGYKGSDSNIGDGDRPDTMLKSLDMDLINRLQDGYKGDDQELINEDQSDQPDHLEEDEGDQNDPFDHMDSASDISSLGKPPSITGEREEVNEEEKKEDKADKEEGLETKETKEENESLINAKQRLESKYHLTISNPWSFAPDVDFENINFEEYMKGNLPDPEKLIHGEHWLTAIQKPENYCGDCRPHTAPPSKPKTRGIDAKAEELENLLRIHGAQFQRLQNLQHMQQQKKKRLLSAPTRTPPSIPSPQNHPLGGRTPRGASRSSSYLAELEHHARTLKSPRRFMEKNLLNTAKKIINLRQADTERSQANLGHASNPQELQSALTVLRLNSRTSSSQPTPVPLKDAYDLFDEFEEVCQANQIALDDADSKSQPEMPQRDPDLPGYDGYTNSKGSPSISSSSTSEGIRKELDIFGSSDQLSVKDSEYAADISNSDTVTEKMTSNSVTSNDTPVGPPISVTIVTSPRLKTGDTGDTEESQEDKDDKEDDLVFVSNTGEREPSKAGRPIPEHFQPTDPDALEEAVRRQQEANAAVDIQRIFRGYVVRKSYKYLMKEERERKEDERKAAIEIQRAYRGHISRKKAIYNREPNPDTMIWAKEFKTKQTEKAAMRMVKAEETTRQHTRNKAIANAKLSVIGPHVEIYDTFHPKKTGPNKKQIIEAAITLQKMFRGWNVRRQMDALKRRGIWHSGSWDKFITDYKDLLRRIQKRYGVPKPVTPFDFKQIQKFMESKKRFESVFDKISFGGELELEDIPQYFKESDLYPAKSEINEAMDSVFRGKSMKNKRGLHKEEALELTFQIYVPEATGLQNRRKSTWMNPIIDGEEAWKLQGSDLVEPAPLKPCMDLVINSIKERKERESASGAPVGENLKKEGNKGANQTRKIKEKRDQTSEDK